MAEAEGGIRRPGWLGRAALASCSRFPWGGRALGGEDPGAANFREVAARVGAVAWGAG